jgi:hypothetical protein
MPVGVAGLRDRRVPELRLHPPDVGAPLKEPGGVAVPHRVGLPVRELRGREQRSPDVLREGSVAGDLPQSVWKNQLALIVGPAVELRLEGHRFDLRPRLVEPEAGETAKAALEQRDAVLQTDMRKKQADRRPASHISQAPWAPWFTKYTCMS